MLTHKYFSNKTENSTWRNFDSQQFYYIATS